MVYGQKPQSIKYFTIMYHKHMSSHVGKDVVLYQSTDVKLLKSLLTMARSIVIQQFTFVMFEYCWLNNMIQHLKHW